VDEIRDLKDLPLVGGRGHWHRYSGPRGASRTIGPRYRCEERQNVKDRLRTFVRSMFMRTAKELDLVGKQGVPQEDMKEWNCGE
jgi:hypothetical protein